MARFYFDFMFLILQDDATDLAACRSNKVLLCTDVGALLWPHPLASIATSPPDTPNFLDSFSSFYYLVAESTDITALPSADLRSVFSSLRLSPVWSFTLRLGVACHVAFLCWSTFLVLLFLYISAPR